MKSITVGPDVASTSKDDDSQDWRGRAGKHKKRIAALLIERGEHGMAVHAADLYEHPELYGRSPRNRISDLKRKNGWDIGRRPGERKCHFYWLRRDGDGRTYPTQHFDGPPNHPRRISPSKTSWSDRPRVTGLPLFDLAVR